MQVRCKHYSAGHHYSGSLAACGPPSVATYMAAPKYTRRWKPQAVGTICREVRLSTEQEHGKGMLDAYQCGQSTITKLLPFCTTMKEERLSMHQPHSRVQQKCSLVTFEVWGVVTDRQLPNMGIHRDGFMLVQGKQADAGSNLQPVTVGSGSGCVVNLSFRADANRPMQAATCNHSRLGFRLFGVSSI